MARHYPVNLVVEGRPVLVVGGGPVALGKVQGLLAVGATVDVVAPDVTDELAGLAGVTVHRRPYERGEAARYRLVFTATDDAVVNQAVFDDAEAAGVWVNAADDPERCSFTLPSRVRRGDVLVAVSSGGRSPAVTAWLRERLDEWLEPELEDLLEIVSQERERLRGAGQPTEGLNWRQALQSGMLERIREGDLAGARELLRTCLSSSSA